MEAEKLMKGNKVDKHQERKRKAAHLESIFENAVKIYTSDNHENTKKNRSMNNDSGNGKLTSSPEKSAASTLERIGECSGDPMNLSRNTGSFTGNLPGTNGNPLGKTENHLGNHENSLGNHQNSLEITGNTFEDTEKLLNYSRSAAGKNGSPSEITQNHSMNTRNPNESKENRVEHSKNTSGISRSPSEISRTASRNVGYRNSNCGSPGLENDRNSNGGNQYSTFKQSDLNSVEEKHSSDVSNSRSAVVVKQEKLDEPTTPVPIMPLRLQKSSDGEVGDECLKFLLFSGKLYHCERVSDLTHSLSKFTGDSVLGRKGYVVVLLFFHKALREVLNYVVGVVDHYTLEEHNIIIKIIKHHTYPTTIIPAKEVVKLKSPSKEVENSASKLVVGSKKLLCNLQVLHGPVYTELVKILDGFGANSAVDHAKISEFNAMVNANADRLDGQVSNILGGMGYPYRGSYANRNLVPPSYPHFAHSNTGYAPLTTQFNSNTRYSPEKSPGGFSYSSSKSVDAEIEHLKRANPSYSKDHVNTVSANQSVRITPRTANSNVDHIRGTSAVSISQNQSRFLSAFEDGSATLQRRNVEDLHTVAELCKEKMKRDMAEQELKSIKAAFEEFKSQMQQHLSQVEERMVLLEAENRTLKGKLSNMHQNNGFAEKKYHELKSQLEELLKST